MKKTALSILIMGSFGLYVFWQDQSASSVAYVTPQSVVVPENNSSVTPPIIPPISLGNTPPPTPTPVQSAPIQAPTPVPTPAPKQTGLYADGTYTGSPEDAYYGTVQVEAIITNGQISDVQFLNYPQDRGTSIRINSMAMPELTQEAIQAQSANVDGVSGASDTSAAFRQSLASALVQARA